MGWLSGAVQGFQEVANGKRDCATFSFSNVLGLAGAYCHVTAWLVPKVGGIHSDVWRRADC